MKTHSEFTKLDELSRHYLVCDLDTDQQALAELTAMAQWHEPAFDLSTATAELLERRARFRKDYPVMTVQLKGDYESRRVWLYEHEILPDKSLGIRNHSPGCGSGRWTAP